jgi:hypothetical protein
VDDGERAIEIERLFKELAEATARRGALLEEAQEFAARLHDIRAAFGNPFFYSKPESADESAANYTASSSHEVILPTVLALKRSDQDLRRIRNALRGLGASVD